MNRHASFSRPDRLGLWVTCALRVRKSDLKMKFGFSVLLGRLAVFLLVDGSHSVNGFSSGAPDSACSTMLPNHNSASAQNSPPPYQITTSSTTYKPGQSISGSLHIIIIILYLHISLFLKEKLWPCHVYKFLTYRFNMSFILCIEICSFMFLHFCVCYMFSKTTYLLGYLSQKFSSFDRC